MENSLVKIVNESGLDKQKQDYILEKFQDAIALSETWAAKAKEIVVTDESQVALMKQAREGRLLLKDKRVEIEKTRKQLKDASLKEGRAIDDVAKALTGLIEPTERYLDEQEKFAERKEAERKKQEEERQRQLNLERINILVPYVDDVRLNEFAAMNSLGAMSDSQFEAMLTGYKVAFQKKVADAQKAEEERIAKEKQEAEEREAQKQENERLKKEADEREKQFAAERNAAAEKARQERLESERILLAERQAAAEKLKNEQEGARKLAAELKEKRDQEEKERQAAEALEAAPDKEKIKALIQRLRGFEMPEVKSKKAKMIVFDAATKIAQLVQNLDESLKNYK